MTFTLDVPAPVAARWQSLTDEERRRRLPALADAVAETMKALDAETGVIRPDDDLPYLPPPGFAEAHRLAREARGDMRSAAEIIRQDRDEADERREAVFRGEAQ